MHPVQTANFHKNGDTGDYSIKGLERVFRLERKRPDELWGCLGSKREHFLSQLKRMQQFPVRVLLVEGNIEQFARKPKYSTLSWSVVSYRLMRWTTQYAIPIWFLGERSNHTVRLLEDQFSAIFDLYRRERNFVSNWKGIK